MVKCQTDNPFIVSPPHILPPKQTKTAWIAHCMQEARDSVSYKFYCFPWFILQETNPLIY